MYKIFNTNSEEWNLYLKKMPIEKRDIYFTKEYHYIQEKNGDGEAELFVYLEDDNVAIYPYLKNRIKNYNLEKDYYDIESAYGYVGPLSNCLDKKFINNFENEFNKYCRNNNIVCEFVRYHPLIKNENIFKENIEIDENRTTISINLNKSLNEIWNNDISSKNRNVIRKALKNKLSVSYNGEFDKFKEIYIETMKKVRASEYYYFNDSYYDSLRKIPNVIIEIKKDNDVIASAMFMYMEQYFHYHLAGSRKEYLKYSPNNLMLWSAIKYAHENGFKKMHLGGGLSNKEQDNLFKFKKSFSKDTDKFYIGKRIHNYDIYNLIIKRWEEKNKRKASLFLQYRY